MAVWRWGPRFWLRSSCLCYSYLCLLLESSESLKETRLLFRVLPVPASVRPAGFTADWVYYRFIHGAVLTRSLWVFADLCCVPFLWKFPTHWCWASPGSSSGVQMPVWTLPVCPLTRMPHCRCCPPDLWPADTNVNTRIIFIHFKLKLPFKVQTSHRELLDIIPSLRYDTDAPCWLLRHSLCKLLLQFPAQVDDSGV